MSFCLESRILYDGASLGDISGESSVDVTWENDSDLNEAPDHDSAGDALASLCGVDITSEDSGEKGGSVVFISGTLPDADVIADAIKNGAEIVILEPGSDPIDAMLQYFESNGGKFNSVHLISHGESGKLVVNGITIDSDYVTENSEKFEQLGEYLTEDADLLLYGCNLAEGSDGQDLIAQIADLTGADIAASSDGTGYDGDWDLEYTFGDVESVAITVDGYNYSLDSSGRIYVKVDGSDAWIGKGNVYTDLNSAILAAGESGEIWIASGRYTPTTNGGDRDSSFTISSNLTIYGGFAGTETDISQRTDFGQGGANETILSGDILGNDVEGDLSSSADNVYHVIFVTQDGDCLINGVTVSGGFADGTELNGNGGGIIVTGNATIENCVIAGNFASNEGGGIWIGNGSVNNVLVTENVAGNQGGGIFSASGNVNIADSDISFNRVTGLGGGGGGIFMASGTVTNCSVHDNYAYNAGGGIYMCAGSISNTDIYSNQSHDGAGVWMSGGTLCDSTIASNVAIVNGGGVYAIGGNLSRVTLVNNEAGGMGGGLYGLNIAQADNLLITNNTAGSHGGGMYLLFSTVVNATVANNQSKFGSGAYLGSNAIVYNSIFWGNVEGASGKTQLQCAGGSVMYSGVQGGCEYGKGNMNFTEANFGNDPRLMYVHFLNPTSFAGVARNQAQAAEIMNANWRLGKGSYAINHGNNWIVQYLGISSDRDGNDRIYGEGGIVDLGAFESSLKGVQIAPIIDDIMYGDSATLPGNNENGLGISYDSSNDIILIINGNVITGGKVGVVDVDIKIEGNNLFEALEYTQTGVKVIPRPITVVVDDKDKIYGEKDPEFTWELGEGSLGLAFDDTLTVDRTDKGENAGKYDIDSIDINDNNDGGNYSVTFVKGTLTIAKRTIIVNADDQNKIYGDKDPEFTFTVDGGLVGKDQIILDRTDKGENVGQYDIDQIIIDDGNNGNNYDVVFNEGVLTIGKRSITITADDQNKIYGDKDPEFTFTVDGGIIGNDKITVDRTDKGENAGEYAIDDCIIDDGNNGGNYDITFNPGTLVIAKRSITITADDQNKIYGDKDPEFTFTVDGGIIGNDKITVDRTDKGENAGEYAIDDCIIDDGNNGGNYDVTFNPGTLLIAKRSITITADDQNKIYGDKDPEFTFTVDGGIIGNDKITVDRTDKGENAGEYAIDDCIIDDGNTGGNYDVTFNPGTLVIAKRSITVNADDQNKIYGDKDPEFTFTVDGGLVGKDQIILDRTDKGENVGQYDIDQIIIDDGNNGNNYDVVFNEGVLTIGKRSITITADDQNKIYGDKDPEFTFDVVGGIIGNDKITVDRADKGENAGEYAIDDCIIDDGNNGGNYDVTFNPGTLVIAKRSITVNADDQNKIYGDKDPEFTFTVDGGLIGKDQIILDRTDKGENVGQYDIDQIIIDDGNNGNNYDVVFNEGVLTIGKRSITITADDQNKIYGEKDPEFTFDVVGGIIGNDKITVDRTDKGENAGEYAIDDCIIDDGNNGGNYDVTFNPGTLVIAKRSITVNADDQNKIYGDKDPEFTFTVDGGLIGKDQIILDRTDKGENVGQYDIDQIIIDDGNNGNNYDVVFNEGVLTIGKRSITINADDQNKIYGEKDPNFTFEVIGGIVGDDKITIGRTDKGENAGEYAIDDCIIDDGNNGGNYDVIFNEGTLTIAKRVITVTTDDKDKYVGQEDPEFTFEVDGGIIGSDKITVDRTDKGETPGDYSIDDVVVDDGNGGNNYEIIVDPGKLTIREITIAAFNIDKQHQEIDEPVWELEQFVRETAELKARIDAALDHTSIQKMEDVEMPDGESSISNLSEGGSIRNSLELPDIFRSGFDRSIEELLAI